MRSSISTRKAQAPRPEAVRPAASRPRLWPKIYASRSIFLASAHMPEVQVNRREARGNVHQRRFALWLPPLDARSSILLDGPNRPMQDQVGLASTSKAMQILRSFDRVGIV